MPSGEVLLIEDDEEIRTALEDALQSEGYQVIAASNGAEGLRALESSSGVSLVLLDLMMPVMNGYEFIGHVRESEGLRSIPVIVVSANAERRRIDGADGVIHKPFDLDRLFDSIRRVQPHRESA
jgi:CheY-like chemotaxis protein